MKDINYYRRAWWATLMGATFFMLVSIAFWAAWRSTQNELVELRETIPAGIEVATCRHEIPLGLDECVEMYGNPGGPKRCMTYRELTWEHQRLGEYYLEHRNRAESLEQKLDRMDERLMECAFESHKLEERVDYLNGQLESCNDAYSHANHYKELYSDILMNQFELDCLPGYDYPTE
jgi:hypothetical protein